MSGSFSDEQVHAWLAEAQDSWVSLHYESPGLNGIGRGEISGGGYTRTHVTFSDPSNRAIWSLSDAKFTGLLKNRLTHFGVWDSEHNGMLRAYGELPNNGATVLDGQGYLITSGKLALSMS